MVIRETPLAFSRALIPRKSTTRIIIHHTVSGDVSAATVHGWHLARKGWGGFGYHYLVRTDGTVERGRPEHVRGVHASRANADSIGIALTGNFEIRTPTAQQMDSLVWLIRDIRDRHQRTPPLPIVGHSDVGSTACPGKMFPWSNLRARIDIRRYTVRAGDTLWSIAATQLQNGVRWVEIQRLNGMTGTAVRVGQVLMLPAD